MSDSLERDLAELEATDPAVREASERLDQTVASIVRRSRDAESTSAALRRVEQERDQAKALRFKAEAAAGRLVDERDEARDLARRLRDQLGFADSRIRTLGRELGQARAELDAERDRRGEDIAEYENACGLTAVAERERDEALAAVRELVVDRDNALSAFSLAEELRLKATAELASARTELTEQLDGTEKLLTQMERERDSERRERLATEADLRSARAELDAVRAARDTLDRELSEVRAEADEKVRAVLAADYRPAAVVHAYDALYCRTCYARFLPETPAAESHPHPLVAVRVSITSRTEEHETA